MPQSTKSSKKDTHINVQYRIIDTIHNISVITLKKMILETIKIIIMI